ncbi:MAG TPA: hypothetical protein VL523_12090 [Terriglobia bacterium]|nr:hypothetical protein [Terriglobia bacterium]
MRATPPAVLLILSLGSGLGMGYGLGPGANSAAPGFASDAERSDAATIEKFIASQESDENGQQAENYTKVVKGDLNHDGIPDAAVLYTLEGGNGTNGYVQYLAAFVRVNGRLVHAAHKPVGGRLYRAVEIKWIKDNLILLNTTGYGAQDPECCPTLKGTTRYALVDNTLTELPHR